MLVVASEIETDFGDFAATDGVVIQDLLAGAFPPCAALDTFQEVMNAQCRARGERLLYAEPAPMLTGNPRASFPEIAEPNSPASLGRHHKVGWRCLLPLTESRPKQRKNLRSLFGRTVP